MYYIKIYPTEAFFQCSLYTGNFSAAHPTISYLGCENLGYVSFLTVFNVWAQSKEQKSEQNNEHATDF